MSDSTLFTFRVLHQKRDPFLNRIHNPLKPESSSRSGGSGGVTIPALESRGETEGWPTPFSDFFECSGNRANHLLEKTRANETDSPDFAFRCVAGHWETPAFAGDFCFRDFSNGRRDSDSGSRKCGEVVSPDECLNRSMHGLSIKTIPAPGGVLPKMGKNGRSFLKVVAVLF